MFTWFVENLCYLKSTILLEPIGGAKPKFSQKSESLTFTEKADQTLSLLCPAMGSPLPSFRFVEINKKQLKLSRHSHWTFFDMNHDFMHSAGISKLVFRLYVKNKISLQEIGIIFQIPLEERSLSFHLNQNHWRLSKCQSPQ